MNDIYDHAPECDVAIWLERAIETDAPRWLGVPDDVACQCQKLRACEQRVRDEYATWHPSVVHHCCVDVQTEYTRGLNAAREAVATMVIETVGNSAATVDQALAAIDALKERP